MRFEVLLHVVGAREPLGTALKGAVDTLFGRVDLGVPRGVARCGESFVAAVSFPVAAWEALAGSFATSAARCGSGGGSGVRGGGG